MLEPEGEHPEEVPTRGLTPASRSACLVTHFRFPMGIILDFLWLYLPAAQHMP